MKEAFYNIKRFGLMGYWKFTEHLCPDGVIRNVPMYFKDEKSEGELVLI